MGSLPTETLPDMPQTRDQKIARLFSAISLPTDWAHVLGQAQRAISKRFPSGVRWIPPENLHATVRFIGNLPTERAQDLIQFWGTVQLPKELPILTLTSCGCFPSEGPERILWAGAEASSGSWTALVEYIDAALSTFGLTAPVEEPVIHITIGRVRNPEAVRGARELLSRMALSAAPLPVQSVGLFASEPGDSGPRYTLVASMQPPTKPSAGRGAA